MYRVIKAFVGTSRGGMRPAWNIVDSTGFVVDTFSLKRDALAWIESTRRG